MHSTGANFYILLVTLVCLPGICYYQLLWHTLTNHKPADKLWKSHTVKSFMWPQATPWMRQKRHCWWCHLSDWAPAGRRTPGGPASSSPRGGEIEISKQRISITIRKKGLLLCWLSGSVSYECVLSQETGAGHCATLVPAYAHNQDWQNGFTFFPPSGRCWLCGVLRLPCVRARLCYGASV